MTDPYAPRSTRPWWTQRGTLDPLKSVLGLLLGSTISVLLVLGVINLDGSSLTLANMLSLSAAIVVVALIFGVGIHTFLYRSGRRSVSAYLILGFLVGFLFCFVPPFFFLLGNPAAFLYWCFISALFGIWAAFIAAVSWFIRRPDKDDNSPVNG